MCHSGPLSFFISFLSISSRKITVSHLHFSVLTDLNNFYPQFLLTIFTHNIFTDLHRSSQIFTGLSCHSASFYLAIFYLAPSLQDLHKSSTDLSKIFQNLPSSIPFYQVPGQSVIPAHSPVFHRSSQIFTDLSCHSPPIYPFFTHHSISKIFTDLLQIFQRSFKNFPSFIPFHWDLDSRSFRPTLQISKPFVSPLFRFKTCISWLILHRSSKFLPPLSPPLLFWTVGHSGPLSKSLFSPSFLPCFLDSLSS